MESELRLFPNRTAWPRGGTRPPVATSIALCGLLVVAAALTTSGTSIVSVAYAAEEGAGAGAGVGEGAASNDGGSKGTSDSSALPFAMHVKTFDNGLRLVTIPYDSPGIIAYGTMVRVGSRNEIWKGRTGFAHFFEHMMFRGTDKFPSPLYEATLTKLGSDHNAFTSDDLTFYHLVFPVEGLEKVIEMESDRFMNLAYSEDDFKTEAGAIQGEYNMVSANPMLKVEETLNMLAFNAHPYGHTTMGKKEDIKAMPGLFDFSREFFRRFYTPDNSMIIIAGDITPEKAEGLVGKAYGNWNLKADIPGVPVEPLQRGMRKDDIKWPSATAPRLVMAWKVPAFNPHGDSVALQVAAEYLFGSNSDLYKRLVVEEQAVESLSYYLPPSRDPGLLRVDAVLRQGVPHKQIADALNGAISDAVAAPTSAPAPLSGKGAGLDVERLESVKSNLYNGGLAGFETPHSIITTLAFFTAARGNPADVGSFISRIQQVNAPEVTSAIEKYLVKEGLLQVTLTGKVADSGAKGDSDRKGGK